MKFIWKCWRCRDHGTVYERVVISKKELPPIERAELMVNGGYAYRLEPRPCPSKHHKI